MTRNRTINLSVGWTFIVLGVAGSVLPILQGFLFFIVGLLFLSREYHWAHRLLERLKQFMTKHFPKTGKIFENAEAFIEKEIHDAATIKGHLWKRLLLGIAILLLLGVLSWGLMWTIKWLWHLIVG